MKRRANGIVVQCTTLYSTRGGSKGVRGNAWLNVREGELEYSPWRGHLISVREASTRSAAAAESTRVCVVRAALHSVACKRRAEPSRGSIMGGR